jgi:DNA polymerase-1
MSADYSQIELRIMAHISEDENMLRAFAEGVDIHRATAAEIFGVAPEAVESEQRRYAKVINFGLIYGMSAFGLAGNLGIERAARRATSNATSRASPASSSTWTTPACKPRRAATWKPCSAAACGCRRSIRPTARAARAPNARRSTRRCRARRPT